MEKPMTTSYVRAVVYLDPETRNRLDEYVERTGTSISFVLREAVLNHLDDKTVINRSHWFELALRMLLRYHPQGDLEKLADETLNAERRIRPWPIEAFCGRRRGWVSRSRVSRTGPPCEQLG
jgi:predicted DNA-binding protein